MSSPASSSREEGSVHYGYEYADKEIGTDNGTSIKEDVCDVALSAVCSNEPDQQSTVSDVKDDMCDGQTNEQDDLSSLASLCMSGHSVKSDETEDNVQSGIETQDKPPHNNSSYKAFYNDNNGDERHMVIGTTVDYIVEYDTRKYIACAHNTSHPNYSALAAKITSLQPLTATDICKSFHANSE